MPDLTSLRAVHPRTLKEELLALSKRGGIDTALLNLKNRQNALMQLYRTGLVSGLIVDTAETQDFADPENAIDGMQEIPTGSRSAGVVTSFVAHYDFGSIASRAIYWCTGIGNSSSSAANGRWDLDTSDDKVSFTERDTWSRNTQSNPLNFVDDYQGRNIAAVSFRYARLVFNTLSTQGLSNGAISQLSTTDHFDDPTPTLGTVVNVKVKLQSLIDLATIWKDIGPDQSSNVPTDVLGQTVGNLLKVKFGQESRGAYGMQPALKFNDATGSLNEFSALLPNDATHLRAHLEVSPSDAFIETGLSVLKI